MSVSTAQTGTTTSTTTSTGRLLVGGVVATVAAALATSAVAVAGQAVGISTAVGGQEIPAPGFAFLTAVFSVVGIVLALVLSRFASRPRSVFVRTTVVLTALSLVPDVLADAATSTKALLMLTHLVAAAIVIPAVARRLAS